EVLTITRSARGDGEVEWDPVAGRLDHRALEGTDAVVHLAGEPIGAARWTSRVRARIRRSRVDGTALIAGTLARLDAPPRVLVSGSAVGYYGDGGDRELDESSPAGDDFLASVCVEWERAAGPARSAGIRVVHPRTGVVLARGGPLIDKVELPFRLGVGGRIGSGRQYVPWIALDDHVRALRHLVDVEVEGPVNLVAPTAATNRALTAALGAVFRRPTVLPIPVAAIRLLYGEMGASLASVSQRVVPRVLQESGFTFRLDELHAALDAVLGPEARTTDGG
ncbi:MAG: TIGR01777 family oxidoreductase, partial [Nitriliruptoraceae bacterium]